MRKIILSLVAVFLSATFVNAQIQINNADDFAQIGGNYPLDGDYIQTADIDLGTITSPKIGTFSGTYDGGNFKITYNATFADNSYGVYGLIGTNNGTIKNLKVKAELDLQGNAQQVGLICGNNAGTIDSCEVLSGSWISHAENGGAMFTGLVAGRQEGGALINNCTATGNCNGVLRTGGIVGLSLGTIKACTFTSGALKSRGYIAYDYTMMLQTIQSYVGGITAYGNVYSSYANPTISKAGITCTGEDYKVITPNTANGCVAGAVSTIDGNVIQEYQIAGTNQSCFVAPLTSAEISTLNTAASTNDAIGIDWSNYAQIEQANSTYTVVNNGTFDANSTWSNGVAPLNLHNIPLPEGGVEIIIGEGKTLRLNTTLVLSNNIRLVNNGTLVICSGGDLVNTTGTNLTGNIVVEKQVSANKWYLTAAPFTDYSMSVIEIPTSGTNADVAAISYDYSQGAWSSNYMTTADNMSAGESFFMWPFYTGQVNFVPNGCVLNNGNVSVTRNITRYSSNGHWMALANPYPGDLDVAKFLASSGLPTQGRIVYTYSNGGFNTISSGVIHVTDGFFVNVGGTGDATINFTKGQLKNYPTAKSAIQTPEFIDFAVEYDYNSIKVHFAQNDEAEQSYDIFDANKLFATTGIIEPYFVTDGIELAKEEVKTLPYYATLNVRSYETDTVRFVAKNIPEEYSISLIDGEQTIDMVEGDMYEVVLEEGENADRFKLLVKKSLSIADVEETQLAIINHNRHINILSQENMNVEVYNALGQKVYQTNEKNFVLNNVPAGAYIVKANAGNCIETAKIIVK